MSLSLLSELRVGAVQNIAGRIARAQQDAAFEALASSKEG